MKEKLQEYALIAEIISAVCIVMSLIFVGMQINQSAEETALNTKSIQAEAYQDLLTQIGAPNIVLLENPELIDIEDRVQTNSSDLTQNDINRYLPYLRTMWRHGSLAYYQYKNGIIDEHTLRSALAPTLAILRNKVPRELWERNKGLFESDYLEYIGTNLE